MAAPAAARGRLELLIVQASPFCNLDCSYCYLPDRADRRRMTMDVLDGVMRAVFSGGLPGAELSIVWHAGEPMAVPREWYEAAFACVARHAGDTRVQHHFQTNAVLIDAPWCTFFRRHGVRVGVSVDGPAFLHDRHRRTRDGRGTHDKVLRGIAQLQAAGLPFHAICVLTRDALPHADAIFDFFVALGVQQVGFNVEEAEAAHAASSLSAALAAGELRAFWQQMLRRLDAQPGRLRVREVESVLAALRDPRFGRERGNAQNQPGRMLNVAWDGSWCHWSPELLGGRHPRLGSLALGNLAHELDDPACALRLAAMQQEIDRGVAQCRRECAYFDFCLGGAPSNKLAEHGSFAAGETLACRLGQKVLIDAVLGALDRALPARI